MKSEMEIVEKYIDYFDGEREYIEKLPVAEQALYKCRLRNTISFAFFLAHERIVELVNTLFSKGE